MTDFLTPKCGVTISYDQRHNLAIGQFQGLLTLDEARKASEDLLRLSDDVFLENVLLDTALIKPDYNPAALIDLLESMLERMSLLRLALYTGDRPAPDYLRILESLCIPLAIRFRHFNDMTRARNWLTDA